MSIIEISAILGALAWIPHLFKIIKGLVTTPEIRLLPQKNVELGFTVFGPIFNLRIAFATKHRDIVVSSVNIKLRHEGGDERNFSWQGIIQTMGAFRNYEGATIPWEKENSVLAIKLNEKEVEERLIRFQEENYHLKKEDFDTRVAKKLAYLFEKKEYTPDDFLNTEEITDVVSFIKQWFHWKQGEYTAIFELESPEKFRLINNIFNFYLTPLDIEILEKNKEFILTSIENELKSNVKDYELKPIPWGWRNPQLKPIAP